VFPLFARGVIHVEPLRGKVSYAVFHDRYFPRVCIVCRRVKEGGCPARRQVSQGLGTGNKPEKDKGILQKGRDYMTNAVAITSSLGNEDYSPGNPKSRYSPALKGPKVNNL
jgi:hypothetical protein